MNIVTWNLNHRIHEKSIPPQMANALNALEPDIIILTEYVPGASRKRFLDELAASELRYVCCSRLTPGQNHVIVVSRFPVAPGQLLASPTHPSDPPNTLHVTFPENGFQLLGLRVPVYDRPHNGISKPELKRNFCEWVTDAASILKEYPTIILGDFNTDPSDSKGKCGDIFRRMEETGWKHVMPSEGWSFLPKGENLRRIDHAFVTNHFEIQETRYVAQAGGAFFAGNEPGAMSDHALLQVKLELRA